jgi:glycosyltransferase involved in cell wall biosynthesis
MKTDALDSTPMIPDANPQSGSAVVILGPSRSGTSAITRLLALLGLKLGPQEALLPPIAGENAKGFFEHRPIVRINKEILKRMGGSWSEPPRLAEGWQRDGRLEDLRERARSLLAADFAGTRMWGFKDPRTSLTLPFWEELLGEARYVICHRRPLDSARSLEQRNGIRLDDGVALWTRYMASALANTAGRSRILIGYEELFTDREALLGNLAGFLGAGDDSEEVRAQAREWIEDDLRHHAGSLREMVEHPAVCAEAQALHLLLELAIVERGGRAAGAADEALDGMAQTLLRHEAARAALGFRGAAMTADESQGVASGSDDGSGADSGHGSGVASGDGWGVASGDGSGVASGDGSGVAFRDGLPVHAASETPKRDTLCESSQRREARAGHASHGIKASLVVVLTDDPWGAMACLESLGELERDSPRHEVVLVDNGSVGLRSTIATLEEVRLVCLPERVGLSHALREGVRAARAEIVVCLPAPALLAEDALGVLCAALEGEPSAVVSVDPEASSTHPAAARAIALRRGMLPEIDVPDEQMMGALCFELAHRGQVIVCSSAHVSPPPPALCRRGPSREEIEVSVIVPTLDATSLEVRDCVRAVQASIRAPHEIIMVDNGSPPQGFTAPVNAALRAARGRRIVVMNDDVRVLDGWWEPLADALDGGAQLVFPLTIQGRMRWDFAAWCFAMGRELLERMTSTPGEFFDPSMVVWCQDIDLRKRMAAVGLAPRCVPESRIRHGGSRTVGVTAPHHALRNWIHAQATRDTETFRARHPDERSDREHDGVPAGLPVLTAEHVERALAEEPIAFHADGPAWQGHTFDWPVGAAHFFIAGEIEVCAADPVQDILVRAIFRDEEEELFWMNLVPGVVGVGRRSFSLPRESARAIPRGADSPPPSWSQVRSVHMCARSRLRGIVRRAPDSDGASTATISRLRVLALPA